MKKTLVFLLILTVLSVAVISSACNNKDVESIALGEGVTLGPVVKGQDIDLDGKTLSVTYKNGDVKEVPITAEMISGFDKNVLGEQEITVTYSEGGKSASLKTTVTVVKAAPVSLELSSAPEITVYAAGEKFRPEGMVVTARFADGSSVSDVAVDYPETALGAETTAVKVTFGNLELSVPVTVKTPDYTATDSGELASALSEAENGDFIVVSGTLGAKERDGGYTLYNVKKSVSIIGLDQNEIYGSFLVDADLVTLRGLNIKNKGWVTGEDTTAHRNAVTVASNKVTLEHNTMTAPDADVIDGSAAIANGIVLSAGTDADTALNIRHNKITGYGYQNEQWSSAAVLFVAGYEFAYGATNTAGSDVSVRITPDYDELLTSNVFENDEFEFIYSDYALGFERPYIYGYASDSDKAKGILEFSANEGMTLVLKAGEYDLGGITVDNVAFTAIGGEAVLRGVTAGENCTFDKVTVATGE